MPYPHHSGSSSTNGYAVRPGSSAALTARTIDATIHPPLVRAQETVALLVPRMAEAAAPLTSPLFLSAVALTLIFVWVAIRMRYRPSALVLSALLVMGLTSFRPVPKPQTKQEVAARRPRTTLRQNDPDRWSYYREPAPEQAQEPMTDDDASTPPSGSSAPMIDIGVDPGQIDLPAIPVPRVPEAIAEIMRSEARMMRDNPAFRAVMQEARVRLREQMRERRWRRAVAGARLRTEAFGPMDIETGH